MTTIQNYSELLEKMVGFQLSDRQATWELDGVFDMEIGRILMKKMQNLTVSVKPTVTVPPAQSIPMQTPPPAAQQTFVAPATQPSVGVPAAQSPAVASSGSENPFEWTKQRVVDATTQFLNNNGDKWLVFEGLGAAYTSPVDGSSVTFSNAHALIYTQPVQNPRYYYLVASSTGRGKNIVYTFWVAESGTKLEQVSEKAPITNAFNAWKKTEESFKTITFE